MTIRNTKQHRNPRFLIFIILKLGVTQINHHHPHPDYHLRAVTRSEALARPEAWSKNPPVGAQPTIVYYVPLLLFLRYTLISIQYPFYYFIGIHSLYWYTLISTLPFLLFLWYTLISKIFVLLFLQYIPFCTLHSILGPYFTFSFLYTSPFPTLDSCIIIYSIFSILPFPFPRWKFWDKSSFGRSHKWWTPCMYSPSQKCTKNIYKNTHIWW